MSVLYILGAGCSWNYAQCASPVPNLRPPLNSDFFRIARKIIDHYGLSSMFGPIIGLNHFIRNINQLYGYGDSEDDTTAFDDPRLNLEGVMNHFYLENSIFGVENSVSEYGADSSRTRTLNELLAYVLAETLSGSPCRKHACLAERMSRGDIVWNFNYDLLMDNALYSLNKMTDSGYVIRFDYTYTDGTWQATGDSKAEVYVLKLHGSLNWLRCMQCGRNLLLREKKFTSALWKDNPRADIIKCPKCEADRWTGLKRVIIPPAGLKNFLDTDVRYLWRTAPSYCRDTERIVVIGYRFSDIDYELDMLLRTMIERGNLKSTIPITIVNPHPEPVKRKLSSIFRKSEISVTPDLDSFLR